MTALAPVPDTPADAETTAAHTEAFAAIEDPATFFKLSSAIDMLRDSSRILLDAGVTAPATVERLRAQYSVLRSAFRDTVTDDAAASQDVITPHLGGDAGDGTDSTVEDLAVADVFQAASMLARWADSLVNVPAFLANRSIHMSAVDAAVAKNATPGAPAPALDTRGGGSYL